VEPAERPAGPRDVTVSIASGSDHWTLRVQAAGHDDLERNLPPPTDDCIALAETSALMVDRYLDQIQWSGIAPAVHELPPPPPPPPWQAIASLGPTADRGALAIEPGGSIDLGVKRGIWQLVLTGGSAFQSIAPVQGAENTTGAFHLVTIAAGVAPGLQLRAGPGSLDLEVPLGLEIYRAQITGTSVVLFTTNSNSPLDPKRVVIETLPFVGARIGYAIHLSQRFSLIPRLEARGHLGQVTFQSPAITRDFDGDAAVMASYVFF
jgi:hypothetical protein